MVKTGLFVLLLLALNCTEQAPEKKSDWLYLFDGSSLEHWKMYGASSDSISPKWTIDQGVLIASVDGDGIGENTGFDESIMTKKQFRNFELELEFMISEGGNSGIMYHVIEDSTIPMDYYSGHEYQILDDESFKDKVRDFQLTGSVFGLFPAKNKTLNPSGEWNLVCINVKNGKVEHWLNNQIILEFDRDSDSYKNAYENSQWTQFPDWGKTENGHITLQDHGDKVAFRNIRIREL